VNQLVQKSLSKTAWPDVWLRQGAVSFGQFHEKGCQISHGLVFILTVTVHGDGLALPDIGGHHVEDIPGWNILAASPHDDPAAVLPGPGTKKAGQAGMQASWIGDA